MSASAIRGSLALLNIPRTTFRRLDSNQAARSGCAFQRLIDASWPRMFGIQSFAPSG